MKHKKLLDQMTIEEKAAFLTGKNEWAARGYDRLGIPELTFSDGPGGVRRQEGNGDHLGLNPSLPATCFPSASTLANSWDTELEEEIGRALGEEAAMQDVCVLLAPGLNLKRNPLCGRNFEYFSEDPYLSGKMAAALIRGIQKEGVGACAKHFAVNNQEEGRMTLNAVVDERTLRELYLTGFEIAVTEGKPRAVMSSYNQVNGIYANENGKLLKQILRDEWGFRGFVVTDWGGGNDFVSGVRNGSNLQMPGCGFEPARELLKAVENGLITEAEVDMRADELLEAALTLPAGIKKKKEELMPEWERKEKMHHAAARRAAAESMVLLKNEGDILPLTAEKKIAFVGEFAFSPRFQGAGSSSVNARFVETIADALPGSGLKAEGFARGWRRGKRADPGLEEQALELAGKADVTVFFLGLEEQDESEGIERKHIRLPENQLSLLEKLAAEKIPVVAVLCSGGVVDTGFQKDCRAVLYAGLSGQAGAPAVLDVLSGKVNPGGRLSETWLKRYEDTPSFFYYPAKGKNLEYREGLYVGYRYFDKADVPVAYPFGYGLSYTTFAYRELRADNRGITVKVKNTGSREGSEIVQIYVSFPESAVYHPEKELKGFAKVRLLPGEEKQLYIPFDNKTFRFFSRERGRWETESGIYRIMAGAASSDIRLTTELFIEGTIEKASKADAPSCYQSGAVREVTDEAFTQLLGYPPEKEAWDEACKAGGIKRANTGYLLQPNDPLCRMSEAKSPVARLAAAGMRRGLKKDKESGAAPDLNALFRYYMPFRAVAKMTAGAVSMEMVNEILRIVNGHFCSGMKNLIKSFFKNRRENREYEKNLQKAEVRQSDGNNAPLDRAPF